MLRQQGRTGTRHGRAYREASWISDDIFEGMRPVSRLRVKTLHTRPAAAVNLRQVSGAALPQRCLYDPHSCTRSPSELYAEHHHSTQLPQRGNRAAWAGAQESQLVQR